ncbi:hypothetical protein Tsubulata_006119 [Turnera subulata]|uniref:Uncharacterized protein n=1 Tax=Turnera subulata TaxID=218843 RepID=A0A9Q0G1I5_9ROSI|nr:hypothetical protein Tsubulata_006119 [Turnera subulata]
MGVHSTLCRIHLAGGYILQGTFYTLQGYILQGTSCRGTFYTLQRVRSAGDTFYRGTLLHPYGVPFKCRGTRGPCVK